VIVTLGLTSSRTKSFSLHGNVNKLFMTGPKVNSEFCFPETLNVLRGEAKGKIEVEGKQNSLFVQDCYQRSWFGNIRNDK